MIPEMYQGDWEKACLLLGSAGVRRSQVTVAGGLLYDDFAARLASGALESPLRPGEM